MKDFKQYANSFQAKSRLGLRSIGLLCQKCENPQNSLKFIHVAGTNGKGSVCAFLECILTDSGLRCGKFISPNMIDVCERISIGGKNISKEELEVILQRVEKHAKEIEKEEGALPTQFEIWTAAAFLYFKEKNCDIVVLETGLGGRLDATNIIKSPLLSVITKIDIDHTEYLGNTIEKIAAEKAGIIKENSCVVSSVQRQCVTQVLSLKAREMKSTFDIAPVCENPRCENGQEIFDLPFLPDLKINLAGIHQTQNAALAVIAAQKLNIDEKYIRSGLLRARNIGRFERICDNPAIIFDGAHNLSGTQSLINTLKRYYPRKKMSVIYASMADKDIDASLRLFKENGFCENAEFFAVTVKDNPRAQEAAVLAQKLRFFGFNAQACDNMPEAYKKATAANDITVICGSLYLYKDLMEIKAVKKC